jgi:hypothetical protein
MGRGNTPFVIHVIASAGKGEQDGRRFHIEIDLECMVSRAPTLSWNKPANSTHYKHYNTQQHLFTTSPHHSPSQA